MKSMNSGDIHIIVIPCYNEKSRLSFDSYVQILQNEKSINFCFVNDGSEDETSVILKNIQEIAPDKVYIVELDSNKGKGNAIFLAIQWILSNTIECKDIGYLDADLSVDFTTYLKMLEYHRLSSLKLTYASRARLLSVSFNQNIFRKVTSVLAKYITPRLYSIPVDDTQCGAKIIDYNIIRNLFDRPFLSRWLFDIELFIRYKNRFDLRGVKAFYLENWVYRSQSKLKTWEILFYIPIDLMKIILNYRFKSPH